MPRLPNVDGLGDRPSVETKTPIVALPGGEFERQTAAVEARNLSGIGQDLAQVGQSFAGIEQKIRSREEAVSRAKAIEEFTTFADQEAMKLETEQDIADRKVTDGYGTALRQKKDEIFQRYAGSDEHNAAMSSRLEGIQGTYARQIGSKGAAAGQKRVLGVLTSQLGGLTAQAMENPSKISSIIQSGDAMIDDMAPAMTPEQEILARSALRKEVALSAVTALANRGAVAEAREMLNDTPGLISMIGPDMQRTLANQFATAEREELKSRQAGQRKLQEAADILGVPVTGLTLAQRMKLAGLSEPAGERTAAQKIADLETVLGPLSTEQKRKALGVETGGAVTDAGKTIEDRERIRKMFGEGSPQLTSFDDLTKGGTVKLSDVGGVRGEYTKLSGDFLKVRDGFSKIAASGPTPAGDMALIFNYMKMLDPGSTVREGEYATASNAGSIPERIRAQYNKATEGEPLTEVMRKDFKGQAENIMRASLLKQVQLEDEYKAIAQRNGMNPDDVAVDYIKEYRKFANVPVSGNTIGTSTQDSSDSKKRIKVDLEGNIIDGSAPDSAKPAAPKSAADPVK